MTVLTIKAGKPPRKPTFKGECPVCEAAILAEREDGMPSERGDENPISVKCPTFGCESRISCRIIPDTQADALRRSVPIPGARL